MRTTISMKLGGSKKNIKTKNGLNQLVTDFDPRSPINEAYRILATNLSFKNIDQKFKYIGVTSSIPSEGKSTTIANLAITLAQSGKKVILVDGDLRRPTAHKIFGLNVFEGLTNALVEGIDPLTLCKPFKGQNLKVLTAGTLPPNSSELLGSARMKATLERLGSEADFVFVDCPPVLGLNDTLAIAPNIDGYLFVVGSGRVPRNAMKQAKDQLDKIGANFLGVVVNGLEPNNTRNSYFNYYGESTNR